MIVVDDDDDDESGGVEGNLVMAASYVSPEAIAFMIKHGSGIVSVGMKGDELERLKLPLMKEDDSWSSPSFTVTVVCIIYALLSLLFSKALFDDCSCIIFRTLKSGHLPVCLRRIERKPSLIWPLLNRGQRISEGQDMYSH